MRLHQIQSFIAVAEDGSLTKAAARLYISQPALTQHVKSLEQELDLQLLRRHPRGTGLTPAGRTFLRDASKAMELLEKASRTARRAAEVGDVEIRVATVRSLAAGLIPNLVSRLPANMKLELLEFGHARDVEDAALSGSADIAVAPGPSVTEFGFVTHFAVEELLVVLPDKLQDSFPGPDVDIADLRDEGWVTYHADHGLSEMVRTVTRAAGFLARSNVRTSQVDAALNLAIAGSGPALVPATNIPAHQLLNTRHARPRITRDLCAYSLTEPDIFSQRLLALLAQLP